MPTKTIDVLDAPEQLNDLLTLVQQGTEIILARGNTPLARLVPVGSSSPQPRVAGLHQGAIQISNDFDAPLPESFWLGEE